MSQLLETRLTGALSVIQPLTPRAELHDLRTPPAANPPTLAIFLYEISEDPTLRNRGRRVSYDGVAYQGEKAPLPLILRYLFVPYAGDRPTEFEMLGRVLQVLHAQSIASVPNLPVLLAPTESLSISLAPLTLEERTRVWWSISQPYRLSLNYEVRVVDIDVEPDQTYQPVGRSTVSFDAPEKGP